jgi:hypothetical protein
MLDGGEFLLVPGLLVFAIVFLPERGGCSDRQYGMLMPDKSQESFA